MKPVLLILFTVLLAIGCRDKNTPHQSASNPSYQSVTPADSEVIDLRTSNYLARLEIHITITPDGLLRCVRVENKSYGSGDAAASNEHIEIRQGFLTHQQRMYLASLLADWDSLSTDPYGGVPDGGTITLRYGGRTVSGGSATPRQVWDIADRIGKLSNLMPVVKN